MKESWELVGYLGENTINSFAAVGQSRQDHTLKPDQFGVIPTQTQNLIVKIFLMNLGSVQHLERIFHETADLNWREFPRWEYLISVVLGHPIENLKMQKWNFCQYCW